MGNFLRKSLIWGFVGLGLFASAFAQQNATFKVTGPCIPCGGDRIVKIVKGLDGVSNATFNASNSQLSVAFNPTSASLVDIQLELSIQGYDAGEFRHDASYKLPECARSGGGMRGDSDGDELGDLGIDDIEGLEKDTDWENPNAFEIVGTSGDDDIDILDEEEEDELTTLLGKEKEPVDPGLEPEDEN